jgi:hypothetical protein
VSEAHLYWPQADLAHFTSSFELCHEQRIVLQAPRSSETQAHLISTSEVPAAPHSRPAVVRTRPAPEEDQVEAVHTHLAAAGHTAVEEERHTAAAVEHHIAAGHHIEAVLHRTAAGEDHHNRLAVVAGVLTRLWSRSSSR